MHCCSNCLSTTSSSFTNRHHRRGWKSIYDERVVSASKSIHQWRWAWRVGFTHNFNCRRQLPGFFYFSETQLYAEERQWSKGCQVSTFAGSLERWLIVLFLSSTSLSPMYVCIYVCILRSSVSWSHESYWSTITKISPAFANHAWVWTSCLAVNGLS